LGKDLWGGMLEKKIMKVQNYANQKASFLVLIIFKNYFKKIGFAESLFCIW